jgi:aerobic C4-dicarboxylate transport protein
MSIRLEDEAPMAQTTTTPGAAAPGRRTPFYKLLYGQVLIAIALGVALGFFYPQFAEQMKPLGDGFVKLIKMMIAPIIFGTVAIGIARMGDMKEVGRVGLKALVYFEAVTTLALVIGLIVGKVFEPGKGINADPAQLDAKAVQSYVTGAKSLSTVDFLLNIIPNTFVDAFAKGEILQVLLLAVLFGFALTVMGERARTVVLFVDEATHVFFRMISIIMRLAPIGAFGAMAFTIGKYGVGTLVQLGQLMAAVYATCLLFVLVGLGTIARLAGFSILKFIRYIKEELLIVLGTSSSESVLPRMIAKLENLGCHRTVVGLVIPTGYSFNLDGTCIYLTMATIFIAQATNTPLTLGQELTMLAVLLLTSKGAAAVTGGGFITLAATLSSVETLPVAGLTLLLGVDRFMSEARALTNLVGNGVATVVVARWENALDVERMRRKLDGEETALEADRPEEVIAGEPVAEPTRH